MKLLSKDEIQAKKNEIAKNEIDQGIYLARKIDTLRATSQSEEVALTQMRKEMNDTFQEEIAKHNEQVSNLRNEVLVLEEQKRELSKPLDEIRKQLEEGWNSLKEKEAEIVKREDAVVVREVEANNQFLILEAKIDSIKDDEAEAKRLKYENLEQSRILKRSLADSINKQESLDKEKALFEAEKTKKKEEFEAWEKSLEDRVLTLNIREKELKDREFRITSREKRNEN